MSQFYDHSPLSPAELQRNETYYRKNTWKFFAVNGAWISLAVILILLNEYCGG